MACATAKKDGSSRYASSIRARSTRLAGSVRERAIAPNFAKSFSPIANSIACRHAVMSSTSLRIKSRKPSGLNQLKCGVDPLELDASSSCCKAPIRLCMTTIASAQPSLDLPVQSLAVFDASVEALSGQNRQFGLRHVQPASMFGRVVPFEALDQAACLSGRHRVTQASACS